MPSGSARAATFRDGVRELFEECYLATQCVAHDLVAEEARDEGELGRNEKVLGEHCQLHSCQRKQDH